MRGEAEAVLIACVPRRTAHLSSGRHNQIRPETKHVFMLNLDAMLLGPPMSHAPFKAQQARARWGDSVYCQSALV